MKAKLFILCAFLSFPYTRMMAQVSLWVGETYQCYLEDYANSSLTWLNINWNVDDELYENYSGNYVRTVSFNKYQSDTYNVKVTWTETDMSDSYAPFYHKSHTWSFTCKDNPIKLSPTEKSLTIGETLQLSYSFTYDNNFPKSISFSSDNTSVAMVDNSGLITAKSIGTATIKATSTSSKDVKTCTIKVTSASSPDIIKFADAKVKTICVAKWDTNGDGELSKNEAAAVTSLGNAFRYDNITSFNELRYFTGLTSIGVYAFFGSSGLTSVTIPNSVTSIGSSAFYGCSGLTSIIIPNSVTSIGSSAFDGTPWFNNQPDGLVYAGKVAYKYKGTMPDNTEIIINDGTLEITGFAFSGCSGLTSVTIPNSLTSIGDGAFEGCSGLTSVTISNSVTTIGTYAFYHCSGLSSVTIGNSVTSIGDRAFEGCSGLTTVTINSNAIASKDGSGNSSFSDVFGSQVANLVLGSDVTSIGRLAFRDCSGLTSLTIGNNVTTIGDWAFLGCSGLIYIVVENGNINYDSRNNCNAIIETATNTLIAGCNNTIIPNSVTEIGSSAFDGCSGLSSVTIPESVTSIGMLAFNGCTGLTKAEFASIESLCNIIFNKKNEGIVYLGTNNNTSNPLSYAGHLYIDGKEVTDVVIPNSVTKIGSVAFYGCSGLTSVTIPSSVTSIGTYAFSNCSGLTSVTIPNSVTSIGSSAFSGTPWFNNQPDGLVYAGKVAYKYKGTMPDNTEIIINDGTLGITGYAFSGCSGLTSVTIPNSVTSIGSSAFDGCSGLTSVTIPNSVTTIGTYAFYGCNNLTTVVAEMATPVAITKYVFSNRANATLYVPYGCKDAYLAADYWTGFKEIVEMDDTNATIAFADAKVKALCVANWDTDGDGELSENEAAAVTSLGTVFQENEEITSFDELQYFTGLTSIDESAFVECTSLKSITIPNNVKSIDQEAFVYCIALTSLTIPNSVTCIGDYAFAFCYSLTSMIIPKSVEVMGYSIFANCTGLSTIKVNEGNSKYDSRDNCNAIIESGSNTLIAVCKNTVIPYTVTSIGTAAYSYCNDITSVVIPENVTTISDYAFYYCRGLRSITFPKNLKFVGDCAFQECTGLEAVNISDLDAYCHISFGWYAPLFYAHHLYLNGKEVTGEVVFPNDITTISNAIFEGCYGITSVVIPEGVTSIGQAAFKDCPNLKSVTMPSTLKSIVQEAFIGCTSLNSITIPDGVTSIGESAFYDCTNLTTVVAEMTTPVVISRYVFSNRANATLYVPKGSKAAYETADYWKEFKKIMEINAPGDLGGDGIITKDDVMALVDIILGKQTNYDASAADVNGDGRITIADVTALVNMIRNN